MEASSAACCSPAGANFRVYCTFLLQAIANDFLKKIFCERGRAQKIFVYFSGHKFQSGFRAGQRGSDGNMFLLTEQAGFGEN